MLTNMDSFSGAMQSHLNDACMQIKQLAIHTWLHT